MPTTTYSPSSTSQIIDAMKDAMMEVSIGQIAAHSVLRALVPVNLVDRYYDYTMRARDRLVRDCGAVFEVVRGEGYRRLDGAGGVHYSGRQPVVRTRRILRRGVRRLRHAYKAANDLTPEQQRRACHDETKMGIMIQISLARVMPDPEPAEPRADPQNGARDFMRALGWT